MLLFFFLTVSLVIGHLYRAVLRSSTISSADFEKVKRIAGNLDPKRPVDEWLAKKLSVETMAALKDLNDKKGALAAFGKSAPCELKEEARDCERKKESEETELKKTAEWTESNDPPPGLVRVLR